MSQSGIVIKVGEESYRPVDKGDDPTSPQTPKLSVKEITASPEADKKVVEYVLNKTCSNLNSVLKERISIGGRVAEGVIESGAQLTGVATVTKYAITGLCVAGVAGAAVAWPALLGIAAVSIILSQVASIIKANRELEELVITVNIQIQRIHNIYCVIEEISSENRYPINTEMLKKYLVVLLTNILIAAGPDTYAKIMSGLDYNPNVKDLSTTNTSILPGHTEEVGITFFKYLTGKKKANASNQNLNSTRVDFERVVDPKLKNSWYNRFFDVTDKLTRPSDLIRGISRDLLLLNVYFSILQSEFDLLSRHDMESKKELYSYELEKIGNEPSLEVRMAKLMDIVKRQNTPSTWPTSKTTNNFLVQLPKSNLSVFLVESSTGKSIENILGNNEQKLYSVNKKPVVRKALARTLQQFGSRSGKLVEERKRKTRRNRKN